MALRDGPDDDREVGGGRTVIGGRYRLRERLGRGGMGVVWRATDELLGRSVAVKELNVEAGVDPAGALREARAVAQIRHPHVIVVHDVVEDDGRPFIVMELVDGGSLADRLAAVGGALSPREAARIGVDLLDALTAAHAHDVLHRDVKPANVLLEAGTGRVVLTDFGIASMPGATTISGTGVFAGTPEYSAPERMQGADAGPASDLWSLGALLCAAVTGESPFRRDSLGAVLHAVVYEEIRPSARLGPLLPVVRGLLERDPERRLDAERARRLLAACAAGDDKAGGGAGGAAYTPTEPAGPRPAEPVRQDTPDPGEPALDRSPRPERTDRLDRLDRHRGARVALVVAGAVAACVGAVTAVTLLNDRTPDGGLAGPSSSVTAPYSPAPTAPPSSSGPSSSSAPPPAGSPSPAPSERATPPQTPRGSYPPAGYTSVSERTFSLLVPAGSRRSTDGERIFYITPDQAVRVGIKISAVPPGGALGAMREADRKGPVNNPGYRDNSVTETTHFGQPAAFWEFTWKGFSAAEGPRHTFDICWEDEGLLYDVWVSAPTGRMREARTHFDTAVNSFLPFAH
ncbi:serine/threonine-protein kinase [Streptomyces antimicrobicus]|uniref:non-specific serine/threonine protein kinase n=1 Tax=Streptomyces antimicrobicus TaxID=2883108 RepID=A0ABS8BAR6_9ACTN|nr:serine/threonine-protein kinase [Streptomyces antimicrobicus]MCB5181731.1 serine/threonine protein kinase [Streptomyces antimicrobicus]